VRMRDQIIVIIAVVFATTAVAVNVFAQTRAEDHRSENERIAIAAAWAQPFVPSTTSAPDTTSDSTDESDTTVPAANGVSTAPGQNKVDDCTPPGQVVRDQVDRDEDKNAPPGQDRNMCNPPGQDKRGEDKNAPPGQDMDTPPGQVDRDEDKDTPPAQVDRDEDKNAPPGQNKDTPSGQNKDE
jgi:hypothetical protein